MEEEQEKKEVDFDRECGREGGRWCLEIKQ